MKIEKPEFTPFELYMRKRSISDTLFTQPSYQLLVNAETYKANIGAFGLKDLVTLSTLSDMSLDTTVLLLKSVAHGQGYSIKSMTPLEIPSPLVPTLSKSSNVFTFDLYFNEARQFDLSRLQALLKAPGDKTKEYNELLMKNLGEFYYIGWT